jgi:hypothetical protein
MEPGRIGPAAPQERDRLVAADDARDDVGRVGQGVEKQRIVAESEAHAWTRLPGERREPGGEQPLLLGHERAEGVQGRTERVAENGPELRQDGAVALRLRRDGPPERLLEGHHAPPGGAIGEPEPDRGAADRPLLGQAVEERMRLAEGDPASVDGDQPTQSKLDLHMQAPSY